MNQKNKLLDPQLINIVIYHKNCADGFGAAWSAWKLLGSQAEYFPAQYGGVDFVFEFKNKNIAVLDFSFTAQEIEKIESNGNKILILDHHKTALQIQSLPNALIDINKSGAALSWEYFHPHKPPPAFIKYIEDRDLWKWQLPMSEEFNLVFQMEDKTFENYSLFESVEKVNQLILDGTTILSYRNKIVEEIASRYSKAVDKDLNEFIFVNSSFYQSEIGNFLARKFPEKIIAIWYCNLSQGNTIVSLRSVGDLDVSKIAATYNGGGHKNAAGFSIEKGKSLDTYFKFKN